MYSGFLGPLLILAFSFLLAAVIISSGLRKPIKWLLIGGLLLRLIGSQLYYYATDMVYGSGDYGMYHHVGSLWVEGVLTGSDVYVSSPYLGIRGTAFTIRVVGLAQLALGTNINGLFFAFSLVGYAGIVAFAGAFARAYPSIPVERYLIWIVLFPSLWYWPSAIGKDALIMAGIGVAVLGYTGRAGRIGWVTLISGMLLVYAIRPQVAALLVVGMAAAQGMVLVKQWTFARLLQAAMLAAAGIATIVLAGDALGVSLTNLQEVEGYLDSRGAASATGGSALTAANSFASRLLFAPVNVLLRPLPWEVRGAMSAIAAIEIGIFWLLAFARRRSIASFIKYHRHHRLFWLIVFFVLLYTILAGVALGNIGLIARQRVHMFPFLFVLFAGGQARDGRASEGRPLDTRFASLAH
jgi:hypothetical protein